MACDPDSVQSVTRGTRSESKVCIASRINNTILNPGTQLLGARLATGIYYNRGGASEASVAT